MKRQSSVINSDGGSKAEVGTRNVGETSVSHFGVVTRKCRGDQLDETAERKQTPMNYEHIFQEKNGQKMDMEDSKWRYQE